MPRCGLRSSARDARGRETATFKLTDILTPEATAYTVAKPRDEIIPIRKKNIRDIAPFDYGFNGAIGGKITDVGRNIGSVTVGLNIQTIPPGNFSSRRHRHLFQEEILVVMSGSGLLHHGNEHLSVESGDVVCYLAGDPAAHTFENTGTLPLLIWAFGNRFRHEVCEYPDHGVAFVEGLGAEIPLAHATVSDWTEKRRRR